MKTDCAIEDSMSFLHIHDVQTGSISGQNIGSFDNWRQDYLHDFDYVIAWNLAEATQLLAENQGAARMLAGGTDLIVIMREGRKQPKLVIDAKHIPELNELVIDDNGLTIGAAVSCR